MAELVAYVATGLFWAVSFGPTLVPDKPCWPSALPAPGTLERTNIERAALVQDQDGGVAMLVGDRYVARSRQPLVVYRRGLNVVAVDEDPDARTAPIWVNTGDVDLAAQGAVRSTPGRCGWTRSDRHLIGG